MAKNELQEVAKRWCLTIRASQVIPVYPLTEDLQPGDVFLVQTPVQDQIREYTRRGYLPLDYHIARLDTLNYDSFYRDSYFKGDYALNVPHSRPAPDDGPNRTSRFRLAPVPASAFPDYTFETERGMGTRLAVPINGVPVGMGFLGASRVNGSVKLSDAFTYGVDDSQLLRALYDWAADPEVRAGLADLRNSTRQRLFLRVVNRVYLVGRVLVTLQAQGSSSGGADVGAAKPINPLSMTREEAKELKEVAESYREAINTITDTLNEGLPGGSLRFASANRGSVVMDEQFERLLAVGYLGFDVEVDQQGRLSSPVATQDLLENRPGARTRLLAGFSSETRDLVEAQVRDSLNRILKQTQDSGPAFEAIRSHLDTFGDSISVPETLVSYEDTGTGPRNAGSIISKVGERQGFDRYMKYRSELNNSLDALNVELDDPVLLADRNRLRQASDNLREQFESSRHVALALRLYYNEVLMRRPD